MFRHVMLVPKSKLLGIVVTEHLQARDPSCRPASSTKALKDDSVPGTQGDLKLQLYLNVLNLSLDIPNTVVSWVC